jgi:hypothetical protein
MGMGGPSRRASRSRQLQAAGMLCSLRGRQLDATTIQPLALRSRFRATDGISPVR